MSRHFKTYGLKIDEKAQILYHALEKCDSWHVDILDCKVSLCRQAVDMPLDEIMAKFGSGCLFNIILRDLHLGTQEHTYLEISFCTMGDPSYFLWVHLNEELLDEFTKGLEAV